ncbi:MAG TPA: hypothetical protein VH054_10770 [Polyangiaceae bacterium]|jgi:hypothetical protein|nr:hypothetical protein [Polyangiaceae bacterium]
MVYRAHQGGPSETIVLPTWQPRWWSLVFVVPLPLSISRDFLNFLSPPQMAKPPPPDDFCGTEYLTKTYAYEQALAAQQHGLQRTLFFIGLMGFGLFAISLLLRAQTTIVIDRGARVLRVSSPRGQWSAAFTERPILIERDRMYFIHAGQLVPVAIAQRGAPRVVIERLRAALASF